MQTQLRERPGYAAPAQGQAQASSVTLIERSTYMLGGQAVAVRVSGHPDTDRNGLFYLHTDHLGSTVGMTDENGVLEPDSRALFYPFGAYRQQPDTNPDVSDRGFTGHRHNDDLGLVYMNARYYAPYLNRFISADTIVPEPANPQTLNRYAYVFNNPTNLTDPSGNCPWCISAAAGAATDVIGQMMLNYFFDPAVVSFEDAWNSINWIQVAWSAVEGVVLPGGKLGGAILGAAGEVAINGATAFFDGGSYSAQQALGDFAFGFVANLAGDAVGDLVAKYGDNAVSAGFRKLEALTGIDPGCAFNSFTEDTLVATLYGDVSIGEIGVGEWVLAYDEETGKLDYFPVTKVWAHAGDELAYVTLEGEMIEVTLGHPFYVNGAGWVDAGELEVGMEVWQADGTTGTVDAIAFASSDEVVYNLTVAKAHTFFVGDGAWLVHNCNFSGGRYGDLDTAGGTLHRHHMPADAINGLPRNAGPAIQMTPLDHQATASWGNSRAAQRHREMQRQLIVSGQFEEAFLMDVNDVQSLFGSKYDNAILEAIDALP